MREAARRADAYLTKCSQPEPLYECELMTLCVCAAQVPEVCGRAVSEELPDAARHQELHHEHLQQSALRSTSRLSL